jgi:hypothetical protein
VIRRRRWWPIAGAWMIVAAMPAAADLYPVAVLRALDKVTARVSTIVAPVGSPVGFGTLEIIAHTCDKTPPEERPEAAAFLHIAERKQGEPPVPRFEGWMFASSPALSAMDHPVYDIWVLDCASSASTAASSASGDSAEGNAAASPSAPSR